MKILWLTNIILPDACKLIGEKLNYFGGWLQSTSQLIVNAGDINLIILSPSKLAKNNAMLDCNNISYYLFPPINDCESNSKNNYVFFKRLLEHEKPDLVHIHGTEMPHTILMINVCSEMHVKVVLSIQGLVSIIAKHLHSGLPYYVIYSKTLRNIVRNDNISGLKNLFIRRGQNEIEAIKIAKHVIGRTNWDKACVAQINPEAEYYHCDETLREEFYNHRWHFEKCEKYSIFLSQGHYPIKGLHFLIQALPIILEKFPRTKVYIGGKNITASSSIKDKLLMTYYGKYIKRLIQKYNLNNNVIFTGLLDEKQMCQQYLRSHVFVCPSSIENSPNSLGEAMILGVPCVASFVGGIPDMLLDKHEGFLYQHDAPYMLAHYVCEIFANDEIAIKFSINSRKRALKTHNQEINLNNLLDIYKKICYESKSYEN